jgi:hypothetical protein
MQGEQQKPVTECIRTINTTFYAKMNPCKTDEEMGDGLHVAL